MVRMWVDRARFRPYPASVQRLLPDRERRAQQALPARLRVVAAVDGDRRRRVLRDARQRPAHRRGRHARRQPIGAARGRRQRPDPRRLPRPRLRDGRDRRRHRRAAADAATRSSSTSGPTIRPPSMPIAGSATPSTPASRNASSIVSAHHGRTSRPRCAACSNARRPTAHDLRHHVAGPRRHRSRPRRRGRATDRMGRARDARPAPHPRALRAGAAAGGPAHRGVPPRHDRDGQPHAHPQGRWRRRRARCVEPAVHEGRRRRRARRRVRHRHVRAARRGPRHVLRPSQQRRRHEAPDHDGRRLRPRLAAPQRAPGPGRRRPRRHRGDDDRASSGSRPWPPTAPSASRSWP